MLAPSSYPNSVKIQVNIVTPCSSSVICKHYLLAEMKFISKITVKTYFTNADFSCNSKNVIYLITCDKCKDEYIGSAVDFKPCFKVHKNHIKTKNERCEMSSRHFNENAHVPLLPLDISKLKSLNRFTRKIHQKFKKCFGIEKDIGKVNFSQLPIGWTVSMTFTAKRVIYIESKSLFRVLICYHSTFGRSQLFLIVYYPVCLFF